MRPVPRVTSAATFFNDAATTEIYTLSLRDALPISRLAIDGEQEYKKQLAAVNRELGNLGAEMKLVDAQFKGQANSSEALRAKHNLLKQSIEQQVGKIVSLQGAVEEATAAFGEADSRTDSYRRQLLSAETALAKLNDELSENDKLLKEAEDSGTF